ncbi:NAD-dependent succinate-semialdehyde dehydrogenase [Sphingosinicella xenopeptidilytica]|uniref:NAD-dependent succinate-semialdehyde dehydrogenase n=1 Tax=Sphingosinicella xenopeptidilytica TaxID=364098 RepID=A0ABW3C3N1_SPHXN
MSGDAYPAHRLSLRIDGEEIRNEREKIPVVDPATEAPLGQLACATPEDVDRAADAASRAFPLWRKTPPHQRAQVLRGAAARIRGKLDSLALIMTLEQGKPLAESRTELTAAADLFDWFAEEGRRVFSHIIPGRTHDVSYRVDHEPVGPIAAFTPWNFPATSPVRKIAAALAAGCTVVIKPAEETPATALAIADALTDAGLPAGVLNVLFGDPAMISERLVASPFIRKISLTGSTRVGRLIGEMAGHHIKPVTMELGGHAPVIVLEDADIVRAARLAAATKFRNAGQVCIGPTRYLVARDAYPAFHEAFREHASAIRLGSGLSVETTMGPLAHARRPEALSALVDDAVRKGAGLWTGAHASTNAGYFMAPTILSEVPVDAAIMNDEPFGPVAIVNPFDSEDEAVAEANRLPYALAAYAFSGSPGRLAALGERIEAGMVGLNGYGITIAETPFGGKKDSGFGSEGGREGLEAYLSVRLTGTTMS